MIEHLDKIVNQENSGDKITTQDQKGVKEYPLFKAVPVSKYSICPILHITIGKGNNVVDNLLEEMQAAAKMYTPEFTLAKSAYHKSLHDYDIAKQELVLLNMYNHDYLKHLKKENQKIKTFEDQERRIIKSELNGLLPEQLTLQSRIEEKDL